MQSRDSPVAALGRPPVVAALGAATILVVVWAAAIPRPARVIPGLRAGREVRQIGAIDETTDVQNQLESGVGGAAGATTSDTVAWILGWGTVALVVIGAAACLAVLWRAWRGARALRTRQASDAPDLDLEALAVAVAVAVTSDASRRLSALSAGTPAEGIVAAWTHLEATLHAAGVPLAASRTSSEVSLDVLRRYAVDPATLDTLAGLYREARWSRHVLTEDDRGRAATAYRSLDADLRAAAPETTRARRG